MALKKGDTCYRVEFDGAKVSYREFVLRTIQTRKGRYSWEVASRWAYWWCKVPGLSWGKRSTKNGDFGFLKNADPICREKRLFSSGRPYAATKAGAIRNEIADLRKLIAEYGGQDDFYEEGISLSDLLKAALLAQKRLKKNSN